MNHNIKGFDPARYTVNKNTGFQDPRAVYLSLRIDQHTTDPKGTRAARQALLYHYIPEVEKYDPGYAAGLRELLLAFNAMEYSFPENGHRDQIPQPGAVYLKQGDGYHTITGLSIDPRTDEIMVHTRAADSTKNMMSTLVPLADFFEEIVADGVRVRTWQEVDPQTGDPVIQLPQELAALPHDGDHQPDESTSTPDQPAKDDITAGSGDEATDPTAQVDVSDDGNVDQAVGDDGDKNPVDQDAGDDGDKNPAGQDGAGDGSSDEASVENADDGDQAAGAGDDTSYGYGHSNGLDRSYDQQYG